jgi:hypothetical protein
MSLYLTLSTPFQSIGYALCAAFGRVETTPTSFWAPVRPNAVNFPYCGNTNVLPGLRDTNSNNARDR